MQASRWFRKCGARAVDGGRSAPGGRQRWGGLGASATNPRRRPRPTPPEDPIGPARVTMSGSVVADGRPVLPSSDADAAVALRARGRRRSGRPGPGRHPGDPGEDPGQPQRGQHAEDAGRDSCAVRSPEDQGAASARLLATVRRQLGLGLRRTHRTGSGARSPRLARSARRRHRRCRPTSPSSTAATGPAWVATMGADRSGEFASDPPRTQPVGR
jgi:hypothetical protein